MITSQEYKTELKRKSIHLISTIIPVIYYFTTREFIIWFVGLGLLIMLVIDFLKVYDNFISKTYRSLFFDILRSDEKDFKRNIITGGTYYAAGIFLSILIFPLETAIISILVLVWCDTSAALIGIRLGRIKIYGNKTLEGTIAFILFGFLICILLYNIFFDEDIIYAGFLAIVITSIFELFNKKLNDNLFIPIFYGSVFTIIKYII